MQAARTLSSSLALLDWRQAILTRSLHSVSYLLYLGLTVHFYRSSCLANNLYISEEFTVQDAREMITHTNSRLISTLTSS